MEFFSRKGILLNERLSQFEEFSDPTLMTSKDEIGLLSTAFNTMTGQLKRSMEALINEVSERKRLTTILDLTTDMVSMATPING